jgi:hypothetical protein
MIHSTPSEAIFNEIKEAAKQIWQNNYSNDYGYVDEKVNRINSLTNVEDNVMVCYRMFDMHNQFKLRRELSEEALDYINANK